MTVAYRPVPDRGLTITVWDSIVTTELLRAHVRERNANPDWPGCSSRGLCDATEAQPPALTDAHIHDAVAEYRAHIPKVPRRRLAIVGGAAAHEYMLALQLALGPTGLVTVLFTDVEDACGWLGVDVDYARTTINELREEIRTAG